MYKNLARIKVAPRVDQKCLPGTAVACGCSTMTLTSAGPRASCAAISLRANGSGLCEVPPPAAHKQEGARWTIELTTGWWAHA